MPVTPLLPLAAVTDRDAGNLPPCGCRLLPARAQRHTLAPWQPAAWLGRYHFPPTQPSAAHPCKTTLNSAHDYHCCLASRPLSSANDLPSTAAHRCAFVPALPAPPSPCGPSGPSAPPVHPMAWACHPDSVPHEPCRPPCAASLPTMGPTSSHPLWVHMQARRALPLLHSGSGSCEHSIKLAA